MSGSIQNPLAAPVSAAPAVGAPQQAPAPANPLQAGAPSAGPPPGPPSVNDALGAFAGVTLSREDRKKGLEFLDYATNEFAKLAHKKGVNRKDVVKATADAIGAGVLTADEGIAFLNTVPDNPDQLRPYLMSRYQQYLAYSVALHAVDHVHEVHNATPDLEVTPLQSTVAVRPVPKKVAI